MKSFPGRKKITTFPVITILLVTLSLLLYFFDGAAPLLQYDRGLVANGEQWRVFTCHFAHWSFEHFLWCTITFLALGYICEDLSRRGYVITLGIAGFVSPVIFWLLEPGMQTYRGLSGLASSIFVFGALVMLRKAFSECNWPRFILAAAAGIGYASKIIYEYVSGSTLFVHANEIFSPVPLVHLAGGAIGILVALLFKNTKHHSLIPVCSLIAGTVMVIKGGL